MAVADMSRLFKKGLLLEKMVTLKLRVLFYWVTKVFFFFKPHTHTNPTNINCRSLKVHYTDSGHQMATRSMVSDQTEFTDLR